MSPEETSHHKAPPLDTFRVKWKRIILLLTAVSWLQIIPGDENRIVACGAEVVFIADSGLLPAVIHKWEDLVLQHESVPLAVIISDLQVDAVIGREIPGAVLTSCALAGETGTT